MAQDVFISYRHEDQEWADRICQALEGRGISCWIAHRDIPAGKDWPSEIMDGLKQSRSFVLVLSSHSINEEQISREVRIAADELKLPIFPFRIEDVQPPKKISYFLGDIQWLDAFGGKFDSAIASLSQRIRNLENTDASKQAPMAPRPTVQAPQTSQPGISRRMMPIGIGVAAVIVIAVIAVILTRPSKPGPIPPPARDVAMAYMNDLATNNIEGAWNLFTPDRRAHFKYIQWSKERAAEYAAKGPFTIQLNNCQAEAKGQGYSCDMNLSYLKSNKKEPATVNVVQEENGSWGVAEARRAAPK